MCQLLFQKTLALDPMITNKEGWLLFSGDRTVAEQY